ncbi:MAG: hypothetical protein ACE5JX_14165 [Acidobacteriota bacterium]
MAKPRGILDGQLQGGIGVISERNLKTIALFLLLALHVPSTDKVMSQDRAGSAIALGSLAASLGPSGAAEALNTELVDQFGGPTQAIAIDANQRIVRTAGCRIIGGLCLCDR